MEGPKSDAFKKGDKGQWIIISELSTTSETQSELSQSEMMTTRINLENRSISGEFTVIDRNLETNENKSKTYL